MVQAKENLVATLSRQLPTTVVPTPTTTHPINGSINIGDSLEVTEDMPGLERAEALLVNIFERTLLETDTPDLRHALKQYLPQAESCLSALRRSV